MAVRARFENSDESVPRVTLRPALSWIIWKGLNTDNIIRVGVFSTLTNGYALTAVGASENFYR